jgi:hypothetical protein
MKDDEWRLITSYTVAVYACGFRAGQKVTLRRDLIFTNADGPTGEIHPKGMVYTIIHGAKEDPGVIWMLQPDGRACTWDDEPEIHEWFEVVDAPVW